MIPLGLACMASFCESFILLIFASLYLGLVGRQLTHGRSSLGGEMAFNPQQT